MTRKHNEPKAKSGAKRKLGRLKVKKETLKDLDAGRGAKIKGQRGPGPLPIPYPDTGGCPVKTGLFSFCC